MRRSLVGNILYHCSYFPHLILYVNMGTLYSYWFSPNHVSCTCVLRWVSLSKFGGYKIAPSIQNIFLPPMCHLLGIHSIRCHINVVRLQQYNFILIQLWIMINHRNWHQYVVTLECLKMLNYWGDYIILVIVILSPKSRGQTKNLKRNTANCNIAAYKSSIL